MNRCIESPPNLLSAYRVNSLNPMGAKLSWRDPLLVSYLEHVLCTPTVATRLPFDELVGHLLECWRSSVPS